MLCLANPDLQWHSPLAEDKTKLTVAMGSITQGMDTGRWWIRRDAQKGENNTLPVASEGASLSWCLLEKSVQAQQFKD